MGNLELVFDCRIGSNCVYQLIFLEVYSIVLKFYLSEKSRPQLRRFQKYAQKILMKLNFILTLQCITFQSRQTHFKNLAINHCNSTGWPLNLEFREIREKSGNLILASKVRELSGNLRKSWLKSGKKECHAFSSVN